MDKRLFVGNLSFDISEDELKSAFEAFGARGATIPRRDSGRPKGFGFVDVPAEQAEQAIRAMSGKEFGGRAIDVSEAKPKPQVELWGTRAPRDYGGFRGGGGGDRGGGGGGRW